MHLDADEEEQRQAAAGDPSAVETWSRSKAENTATDPAAGSSAAGANAASSAQGGTNSESPLPNPPAEAGKGVEDEAREQHTEHDEAAIGEATVKPHTDANAAAAAAAEVERDA